MNSMSSPSVSMSTPLFATSGSPRSNTSLAPMEDYVSKYQQVVRSEKIARQSLFWSAVNAALFAIVLYDLTESCSKRSNWVEYIELAFVIVLFVNILYHICNYFFILFTFKPVHLTIDQKKLLGINEHDPKFPTMSAEALAASKLSKKMDSPSPQSPMSTSASSWLNLSLLSQKSNVSPGATGLLSTTPNLGGIQQGNMSLNQSAWSNQSPLWNNSLNSTYSNLSNSWMYHTSPGTPAASPPVNVESDEPVIDEASLIKYLDKLDKMEQKFSAGSNQSPLNSSPNNLSMLWNSHVSPASSEMFPMPYQLATNVPVPTLNKTGSPSIESLPGMSAITVNEKFWQQEGVSQEKLSQWNKNLRQYITVTVLNPVLREIDDVNQALQRLGFGEEKIGVTGLDKLERQLMQVTQAIPNFATLIPFMEVAQNQEYLLQRVKELSNGGCISEFRWNSGSSYNRKPWDETLPSDAQLIMHFLAMYLDYQLPPMRHRPDPRPFSAVYLSKPTDKPKPGDNVFLVHQVTQSPPHFVLIWKNKVYEAPKGRNNLLHTLLLFLHKLKKEEAGMLGRINLGPSGLNIMWVLNEA